MADATGAHVPGIGHLSKKEMYIGGGAAVIVIFVALYRQHKNSQAAAAAAAANTTSTSGSQNIDPVTGLTAGSPEDVAALEAQSSYANSSAYGYASGGYNTGYGTGTTGFTSNGQWSQAAEQYLVQNAAADAATVSAALGAYISGQYVTPTQANLIEQAIAFEGPVPQAGINGYPPAINTVPPTSVPIGGGNPPGGGTSAKQLPPVGTQINVPFNGSPTFPPSKIAEKFGISLAHLMQYNAGKPTQPTVVTGYVVPYSVQPQDTLQRVASEFEISIPHLQEFLP